MTTLMQNDPDHRPSQIHLMGYQSLEDVLDRDEFAYLIQKLQRLIIQTHGSGETESDLRDRLSCIEAEHHLPISLSVMPLDQLIDELEDAMVTYLEAFQYKPLPHYFAH